MATPTAGIGFKPEHFDEALACPAAGLWFEVHAENYMVDGGPRLAMLDALAERFPVSLHGVGLSLAGVERPDRRQLEALVRLVDRCRPFLVSEHLAWSRLGACCFPDLLPFPRTHEALDVVTRNIDIVQSALGRQILIENPSLYVELAGHDWGESDFLTELVRRTGCGLLVDVNNIVVSATNLGFDALAYVDGLPAAAVGEIHVAGHRTDPRLGDKLLIDSHDTRVPASVWTLLGHALDRFGSPPTLIERDGEIPPFDVLMVERGVAAAMLADHRAPAAMEPADA
jgi:uncharacterized protein (UPF0276 family)